MQLSVIRVWEKKMLFYFYVNVLIDKKITRAPAIYDMDIEYENLISLKSYNLLFPEGELKFVNEFVCLSYYLYDYVSDRPLDKQMVSDFFRIVDSDELTLRLGRGNKLLSNITINCENKTFVNKKAKVHYTFYKPLEKTAEESYYYYFQDYTDNVWSSNHFKFLNRHINDRETDNKLLLCCC
jgi:hypothetical protein